VNVVLDSYNQVQFLELIGFQIELEATIKDGSNCVLNYVGSSFRFDQLAGCGILDELN
jgi:hypothetical protein